MKLNLYTPLASSSDQYTVRSFMVIEINVNVRPFIAPHLYTVLSEGGGDLMTFASKDERSVRLCCYELY